MKCLSKSDLNEDQLNALNFMHAYLQGPNRQMVLTGPAGTGKTSLVNVLLDELDSDETYSYVCTAPTNKAVGVIAENTHRPFCKTIYSIMGLVLVEIDDRTIELKEQGKCHFDEYDLIIIDEASMVPAKLIVKIQEKLRISTRTKIIYVGDRCQLPPVEDQLNGMEESLVFSLPPALQVNLTKVMRTAAQNPILGVVTKMRENMKSPTDLFEHVSQQGDENTGIWFYDKEKEFMHTMLSYFTDPKFKENSNYALAVAYTNVAVDALNERIRRALYPHAIEAYEVGEEIRVAKPYMISIADHERKKTNDGMQLIYSMEERLHVLACEPCEDPFYQMPCYKMRVENFNAIGGRKITVTAYVIRPNAIALYYQKREELANSAKEKILMKGYNGSRLYTPKEAWADYMKFKNYFLSVGYIYALTTHKAQGTTIQNVFAVERNLNREPDHEKRNKLKYTAFTRAAKELHVLM